MATSAKSSEEDEAEARLHDILTEEVSLVDRAANKRKFILVKMDSIPDGAREISSNGDGRFSLEGLVQKSIDELIGRLSNGMQALVAVANAVKDAEVMEDGGDMLPPVMIRAVEMARSELAAVVGMISDAQGRESEGESAEEDPTDEEMADTSKQDEEEEGDPPMEDEDGETPDAFTLTSDGKKSIQSALSGALQAMMEMAKTIQNMEEGAEVPAELGAEARKIWDDLGALVETYAPGGKESSEDEETRGTDDTEKRELKVLTELQKEITELTKVSKRGRKMSSSRLKRFRKALDDLYSILTEVTEAIDQSKAAATPTPVVEKNAATPSASPAPAAKTVQNPALQKKVTDLAKRASEQEKTIKKQAKELQKLGSATTGSRAIPVEKSSTPDKPYAWPMDMNQPRDRDSVSEANWMGTQRS